MFSAKTFGVLTLSNAEQQQSIHETDQLLDNATTYEEKSHDGTSTASFNVTSELKPWLLATGGVTHSINRINYNIQQPVPLPNPYSASADSPSVTSIVQQFHADVDSAFVQGTFALPQQAVLTLSGKADHWGYGNHTSLTPRGLFSVPVLSHRLTVGYAEYTQMPSFLSLLAFPSNRALTPIKAEHTTFDLDLLRRQSANLTFSAYRKQYFSYPVPLAYPMLSMANVADTNLESHPASRLRLNASSRPSVRPCPALAKGNIRTDWPKASASYARAWYSDLDGVLRRGNYDIPLTVNTSALITLHRGYSLSARYSGASGRPYTPDDLTASVAQDRDVYDLTRINLARSNPYGRLDLRLEQKRRMGAGTLTWNVGLLNVLNQKNFYAYLWEPLTKGSTPSEQDQMPCFPEGSIKYIF